MTTGGVVSRQRLQQTDGGDLTEVLDRFAPAIEAGGDAVDDRHQLADDRVSLARMVGVEARQSGLGFSPLVDGTAPGPSQSLDRLANA
jgi:hypothetical protein